MVRQDRQKRNAFCFLKKFKTFLQFQYWPHTISALDEVRVFGRTAIQTNRIISAFVELEQRVSEILKSNSIRTVA